MQEAHDDRGIGDHEVDLATQQVGYRWRLALVGNGIGGRLCHLRKRSRGDLGRTAAVAVAQAVLVRIRGQFPG
ncbi:hypothetical protein D3C81_1784140 [compost metagenome]